MATKKTKTVKAYALTCNGKLLNENGQYFTRIAPAISKVKSEFIQEDIKEYGWEIVPCTITYEL